MSDEIITPTTETVEANPAVEETPAPADTEENIITTPEEAPTV